MSEFCKKIMKRNIVKTSVFISVCGIFIILFVIFFRDIYRKQNEKLCSDASLVFVEVVQNEVNQAIKSFSVAYDPLNSPNGISGDEKKNWSFQDYITTRDPNRHVLDSLFQSLLKEKHVQAKVAIRCIWKGKVIDTSADSTLYKEATPLKSILYRLNEKREDNITLQAYADFSVHTILVRMGWFWGISLLVLLTLLGGGWYLRRLELNKRRQSKLIKEKDSKLIELQTVQEDIKKTNELLTKSIDQKETELTELRTRQQTIEKTSEQQAELIERLQAEITVLKGDIIHLEPNEKLIWIELPYNLYFDEKHGLLRNENGDIVQLKNNSLRMFCHFLKKEKKILAYKELCTDIMHVVKGEPEDSDLICISSAISRLRKELKLFSCIKIISVGKVGYQMLFSNYQNDTTQPGKSD